MDNKLLNSAVFNTLKTLHEVTPQDDYLMHYYYHRSIAGEKFFDVYHLAFYWGSYYRPKRVMEIGSRTGLSLCQLLSGYIDTSMVRVVLFDLWSDGLSTPELIIKHLNHLGIHTEIIEFYQGDSRSTVPSFMEKNTEKFDWILVDGDHSPEGAWTDLENAHQLVARGGVIVFDDIVEFDGIVLMPTWEAFKQKYANQYIWHQNLNGKGVGWAVRI